MISTAFNWRGWVCVVELGSWSGGEFTGPLADWGDGGFNGEIMRVTRAHETVNRFFNAVSIDCLLLLLLLLLLSHAPKNTAAVAARRFYCPFKWLWLHWWKDSGRGMHKGGWMIRHTWLVSTLINGCLPHWPCFTHCCASLDNSQQRQWP